MADSEPSRTERDADLIAQARRQMDDLPAPSGFVAPAGLPPPDTFPGYEVVRAIHHGGQGAVYLAIQLNTRRIVAIKVMHGGPHIGASGRTRFQREVQILGQLNHPSIVRIFDSGATPDGGFFYVMDYVAGLTLDQHLSASRPSIPDLLRLFARIAEGVNAAHLKGVVHRDLKPANVRVDSRGEPIIVDFGLAKIAAPDAAPPRVTSATGQFIGSLPWASPEQAEGNPAAIDARTDVYSLGVMLYQALTGRFPYSVSGNMRDVLDNILRAVPARPGALRRQIRPDLETIVLKCLAKEPSRRYQNAGEVSRDLAHFLAGEPIEARRDSAWYVLGRTLSRYRAQAAVAAAFAVLLIASVTAITLLARSAREARWTAIEQQKLAADRSARAEALERDLQDLQGLLREERRRAGAAAALLDAITAAMSGAPEGASGVDLLRRIAGVLDAAGEADPRLRARLHRAVGGLYARLGESDLALEQERKAAELVSPAGTERGP